MNRLFLLPVLFALACFEDGPIILPDEPAPVPPEAVALVEGSYELQILSVNSLSCRGMRPADLLGESLGAELVLREHGVKVDLEGVKLTGSMKNGLLDVSGGMAWSYPEETEPAEDEPKDEGNDEHQERGNDNGGSSEYSVEASLELQVITERLAEGRFTWLIISDDSECSVDTQAALLFIGESEDKPVVAEEDEDADADADTAEP
jgi:hypothetical protein